MIREGEVAFFSAKRRDGRNRADLVESASSCHYAHKSEDYTTTAPQPLYHVHFDLLGMSKMVWIFMLKSGELGW